FLIFLLSRCLFLLILRPPPSSPLFPCTTLFRSPAQALVSAHFRNLPCAVAGPARAGLHPDLPDLRADRRWRLAGARHKSIEDSRSEEHTSELQSRENLVCRLLLEKKKNVVT